MTDYKNMPRYIRPSPPSELKGFLIAAVIMVTAVAVLAWVDSMLFDYPVVGTF